ncbi:MAG: hypothetical protein WCK41_07805 [Actinomycetes bacterium]
MTTRVSIRTTWWTTLVAWRQDFVFITLLAAIVQTPLVFVELFLFDERGVRHDVAKSTWPWVAALILVMSSSLAHHFLAGILEQLERAKRQQVHRPTVLEMAKALPWLKLLAADAILTAAITIGFALFVVPGMLLASATILVMPLINIERKGVFATMRRSVRLVRPTFVAVLVVWLTCEGLELGGGLAIAAVMHALGNGPVFAALGHLVPEIVLMPLVALPAVMMIYFLLDEESRSADLIAAVS